MDITGTGQEGSYPAYARVVRTGSPKFHGSRSNPVLVKAPFLLLIVGTVALGGINAARAYKRQKDENPSHNPFLP
ncbi:hypothetical protein BVC80_1543g92 [Macleaya cordata]|uniref:Transmembrane protein n=1 Tax=Macleaya cordata TaxID=56857 RepID=A0A200R1V8_MACCD|nr:hypothetical protein BVC80_1543g92 [Macleaya cordata]